MDLAAGLASTVIFLFTLEGTESLGTAFLVGYPVPGATQASEYIPIVVTAKHVIGEHKSIVGRFSPATGSEPALIPYDLEQLRRDGDLWIHQDDGVDIVAFRSMHFRGTEYEPVPIGLIADTSTFRQEDIKIVDRVVFPGLLLNFMGATRNCPITRAGTIAALPKEAVPLHYFVGSRVIETKQEVILLDATSIPGASGSPVFLWPGPRLKNGSYNVGGDRPWLIGIMHGFYNAQPKPLVKVELNKAAVGYAENSGIAVVFPSWRLKEILDRPDVAERMKAIARMQR